MITITESARELVGAVEHPPDKVLRLEPVEPQKLGLVIGEAEPDDQVVERQGVDLLHIPAKISEMLDGAVLDSVPTADGMALTINPPASGGPQTDPPTTATDPAAGAVVRVPSPYLIDARQEEGGRTCHWP